MSQLVVGSGNSHGGISWYEDQSGNAESQSPLTFLRHNAEVLDHFSSQIPDDLDGAS